MSRRLMVSLAIAGLLTLSLPPAWAQRPPAAGPQLFSSTNFQLYTDLSKEESELLLERLETMVQLVSRYFGRPLRKQIRMFVVHDLENWPAEELGKMSPEGLESVRAGGGLTVTRVQGLVGGPKLDADAIVYSVAARGTPMHEAIHAYCGITFGNTGPIWYAEGMAEVGKYWKENDKGVNAHPEVIRYLKSSPLRPVRDLVDNPLERTGDSWQNYAWRWALCHLLGFNENYTERFKPLGLALMAGKNTSFHVVYGSQLEEIEFEYRQFLQDLEPGYRCDLCSWDWKTRFKPLSGKAQTMVKVAAGRGWQASRVLVKQGMAYTVSADGEWTLGTEQRVSADGDDAGRGKLLGAVLSDYALNDPLELGREGTFLAPADGKLYLRCRDDWGRIAENSGTVTVRIRLASEAGASSTQASD